jgi:hypothetical protein
MAWLTRRRTLAHTSLASSSVLLLLLLLLLLPRPSFCGRRSSPAG